MARIRANFVGGVIGTDISAIATTMTASRLSLLPTIPVVGPATPNVYTDVAAITLDPNAIFGEPEIVWITAHTAGQSTATILRAQEGTTARQHLSTNSVTWIHSPTKQDWDLVTNSVNVKEYGAKGDLSHNDTQAFINAIAAADALGSTSPSYGGAKVYVPPGTYLVDCDAITTGGHHVSIIGASMWSTYIRANSRGTNGRLITVTTAANGDLTYRGEIANLHLDGNQVANYGIYLSDGTSWGKFRDIWIESCTGDFNNPSDPGYGIYNVNHSFSVHFERIFAYYNKVGVRLRGACQNSVFKDCQIFGNGQINYDLGDGTSRVGRLLIDGGSFERANHSITNLPGNSSGDTIGLRLNWVDPIDLRSIYTEAHTTANSHDIEVVSSGTSSSANMTRINIDGYYAVGSREANNSIVLPSDDFPVILSIKNAYMVDYNNAFIANTSAPNKWIFSEGASGTSTNPGGEFTTLKDIHTVTGQKMSTPYGGLGRVENLCKVSEQFDQSTWQKTNCTVTPDATAGPTGQTNADLLTFTVLGGRVQQDLGAGYNGKTMCFSVWLKADSDGFAEVYFNTNSTHHTNIVFVTPVWKRYHYVALVSDNNNCFGRIAQDSAVDLPAVYAWGAQFENARTPGPYMRTTGSTVASGGLHGFYIHPDTKVGFGVTPNTFPISVGGAASDPASTQTLANNVRTLLIELGLATT